MKIKRGLNQEYADFDEIDEDIEEARSDFENGRLSFDGLRALIGPEAAQSCLDQLDEDEGLPHLFDDPEDF